MNIIAREHGATTGFTSTTGLHDCAADGCTNVQWNDPIAYVAKNLWPLKTIENFAAYIGCAPRTAAYILSPSARRKTMRADFIRRMLTGKHGGEFLKAWMDQSDAEWWRRMVELEKKQVEQEKLLTALREAIKP